ncbi:MAG: hypothetical protein ACI9EP_001208 [Oceanospirillaceae bacterium]|jgi:hypothetical protein
MCLELILSRGLSVVNEADEKRVIFDFEIDFSNGGGMQGQRSRFISKAAILMIRH